MASGHVNRTNRPNTWLHRPSLRRDDSSCQPGAVHTWHMVGTWLGHQMFFADTACRCRSGEHVRPVRMTTEEHTKRLQVELGLALEACRPFISTRSTG